MIRIGLAGDTMLGRGVAQRLAEWGPDRVFSADLVDVAREADLVVLNLECCISLRGTRWPARGKPFFFRAPPAAVDVLARLGVDCVTLANNHALDYGRSPCWTRSRIWMPAGSPASAPGRTCRTPVDSWSWNPVESAWA